MLCYFLVAVAKFVDLARNAKYSICARVALKRWAVELGCCAQTKICILFLFIFLFTFLSSYLFLSNHNFSASNLLTQPENRNWGMVDV